MPTRFNYLGKSQWPDPLFDGLMSDVRVRYHALGDSEIAALARTEPPRFAAKPVLAGSAEARWSYRGSLADHLVGGVSGGETFAKLDGPEWLTVGDDGTLSGIPSAIADLGANRFLVEVANAAGERDVATLELTVEPGPGPRLWYGFDGDTASRVGGGEAAVAGEIGFADGRHGSAVDLMGSGWLELPERAADTGELTVASWVYWPGGGDWLRIFDFGNNREENLFLTPRASGGNMRFSISDGTTTEMLETRALPTDRWVHVAVTLGDAGGRLYVGGSLVEEADLRLRPSDFRPRTNYLGKSQWPDPLFNGRLDEFFLAHRELDAAEIAALAAHAPPVFPAAPATAPEAAPAQPYAHSLAGIAGGGKPPRTFAKASGPAWLRVAEDGALSGVPTLADVGLNRFSIRVTDAAGLSAETRLELRVRPGPDLAAHYEFDDDVRDSAGEFDGVAADGPGFADGRFGRALRLDGGGAHVRVAGRAVNHDALTLAARVRWDGGADGQAVAAFGTPGGTNLVLTPRSPQGRLRFGFRDPAVGSERGLTAPPMAPGEWAHLAVTLGDGFARLYVNGREADAAATDARASDLASTRGYLGHGDGRPAFHGLIGDLRIYRRVVTPEEIERLAATAFAPDPPLVPHSRAQWASQQPFPAGQAGALDDPDGDGLANALEFLLGSDPLAAGSRARLRPELVPAAELGAAPGKSHLTLRVRVRRDAAAAPRVRGAETLQGLAAPEALERVKQAGPPVAEGDFERFTFWYELPIEDTDRGFMRLESAEE